MTDIDPLIERLEACPRLGEYQLCHEAAAALAEWRGERSAWIATHSAWIEKHEKQQAEIDELRDDRQKLLKTRFENQGEIDRLREALKEYYHIEIDGRPIARDALGEKP